MAQQWVFRLVQRCTGVAAILLVATGVYAQTAATGGTGGAGRNLPDFADLAERQGKVVVNISTTQVVKNRSGPALPFDEDDPVAELFRRFMPRGLPRESERHSLGSGFIISAEGYILTNAHVVEGADEVMVRLTDKREFSARVIGADKRTDVALIKIEATHLPTARLGDPEKLRVGEWVAAIGSPFGFESSVTAGIVSAKGRSLPQENYVPFIQTDVAVNPGNSGGPLFNMNGEVVGINSQIYSRSGGFMGLSFAIPIDVALEVQNQLRATGKVSRGRMGVVIQEVTRELAESFGLEKAAGALVNAVEKGGPAEQAGIEPGDVILRFNGKPFASSAELPRLVAATRPGAKATVQIWRKGSARNVTLTVGEIPEEQTAEQSRKPPAAEQQANRLGLVVSELTLEQRQQLNVPGGLRIEEVRSNAARVDLRPGDILLSLIHKGVSLDLKSAEQFNKRLAQFSKGDTLTLLVRRGDSQTFVTLKGFND
ncbi:MAG: DegQ family serine endoprotease [Zoogloeaceae bacterium]|jgi:serine protease Do|nr:DegQ family serine endoprotease [Zoogloeaceae bacterium]